ncbi:MAG: hypothetical protein AUH28_00200 [Acidobacteria bacterium 13_1_40CM_56_16]|nr:MAG: hypothetical protein AUH28_00200 [Acidobacteria bacterium 13_1_40CM_56_16]OLD69240.1 MAG: hypothetical protein AUI45_08300 [Acidobacteria bacterium 13_1_40CM_2_56_11]
MFITKKHIPRRRFLQGAGATIALPLLESMFPAFAPSAKAEATGKTPRFVGIFNPHGWEPAHWAMEPGELSELPFILKPLEPWKNSITVISGLDATSSMPGPGETGGDHSRSAATFSGVQPKKTVSADIHLGITIDQIIAQKYGQSSVLPSLQVKCEDQSSLATCPWGYSCAYVNSVSWSGPARPLPFEANPQVVFEQLFGDGSNPQERASRKQAKASLLDAVTVEVARLNRTLPATDRTRLNEYLEDIREIERRLKNLANSSELPASEVPFGIPESFTDHINLLWDLQVLAFRGDITRVTTLMYAHDVSMRVYPESGVLSGNHPTSHHGERPAIVENWAKINRYHVQCLTPFLAKLKSTPDGDASLLDNTLIFWASNMSNGNLHSHKAVPNMLIGGAMGRHRGGQHIQRTGTTANLLLKVLHMYGIEQESVGDSTGELTL